MPHIPRIDQLLAAEVDGSIEPAEREELFAHLEGCPDCRDELARAKEGYAAARSVPAVEVPDEIADRIRAAVTAERNGPVAGDPSWAAGPRDAREPWLASRWRVVVGAAAAALVVLGAVVVVPQLQGSDGESGSTSLEEVSGGGAPAAESADDAGRSERPPGLERSSQDFDQASLVALAAQTTADPVPSGPIPSAADQEEFAPALTCVESWAEATAGGVPLRVIEATYEGKPAYIGVFRVDEDPPKVIAWAVRQRDCRVLAVTSDRL